MKPSKHQQQIFRILWIYAKLLLVLGVHIIAFIEYPSFFHVRWILLVFQLGLAVIIKLEFRSLLPLVKFLMLNLIPIFLIFYFSLFDFIAVLSQFGEFLIKILILLFSVVLFTHCTNQQMLVISLTKIGIPKRIAFIILNLMTFIPVMSRQLRIVVISQKARGYKIRLRQLQPIFIPTLSYILETTINLSLSLESRGFDS